MTTSLPARRRVSVSRRRSDVMGSMTATTTPTKITVVSFNHFIHFNRMRFFLCIFKRVVVAGSVKSQLIDHFRGHIVFTEAFGGFMLIRTK